MRSSFLLDYTLGAMKVLSPTSVLQGEEEDEQTVTRFAADAAQQQTMQQLLASRAALASPAAAKQSAAAASTPRGGDDDDDDFEIDSDLSAFEEDEEDDPEIELHTSSPANGTNGHASPRKSAAAANGVKTPSAHPVGANSSEDDEQKSASEADEDMEDEGSPTQQQQESEEEADGADGEGDGFLSSSSAEDSDAEPAVKTPKASPRKTPSKQQTPLARSGVKQQQTPQARSAAKQQQRTPAVAATISTTPVSTPQRPPHSTGKKAKGTAGRTAEKSNSQQRVVAPVTAASGERAVSEVKKLKRKKAVSAAVSEPPAKRKTGSRLNL